MKRFPAILLAAMWLGSCSDGGSLPDTPVRALLEICARTEGVVNTRSVTPLTSGRLGIYVLAGEGYVPQAYLYTAVGGVWESALPPMLTSSDASVCAWYPYDYFTVSVPDDMEAVPLQAQKYDRAYDLTYMTPVTGLNAVNNTLEARLTHACSMLEFRLTRDTYTGTGRIGTIRLSASGLLTSAKLDITSGTYSGATEGDVSFEAGITITDADPVTVAVLLPPAVLVGAMSVTFTVDEKERTVTLPAADLGRLDAGNAYIIRGALQEYDIFLRVVSDKTDGTAGGEIIW